MAERPASAGQRCLALYNSVGSAVTHWDLDPEALTLERRGTLQLPSVVQYGWPHPAGHTLYLTSSDAERGSPAISGSSHVLTALAIAPGGELSLRGTPAPLRQRAIHTSVDRAGKHVLTCYNAPPHVSVHPIAADGSLGALIDQRKDLDLGVFCHQIQTLPSDRAVLMVTRGHNPGPGRPAGEPGALKLFGFADGRLVPGTSIAPFGRGGHGYGPRHATFHPNGRLVFVLVELQNELHVHRLEGDAIEPEPAFVVPLTASALQPGIKQMGGAIHVHPLGHVVYASNRVSATTHPVGAFPFRGGENNIAVFAIDSASGAPTPIQFVDPQGFHVRSFTIAPGGRVLIAATLAAMDTGAGTIVPAGLSLFRVADDGRLHFARRYDIDLAPGEQQMWVKAIELVDAGTGNRAVSRKAVAA